MEFRIDSSFTPILELRTDVLNFLEAIDPEPTSELNTTGHKFAELLNQLHEMYQMEYTIEHMESCYYSPDFINPHDKN
jgi:hypothetical protein